MLVKYLITRPSAALFLNHILMLSLYNFVVLVKGSDACKLLVGEGNVIAKSYIVMRRRRDTADQRQQAQEEALRKGNKETIVLCLYSCVVLVKFCCAFELFGHAAFGRVIL